MAHTIERGDLTQLEFIDVCARDFRCDGVALDAEHFPRIDDDYLAQIKKMATDRGLNVAALLDRPFFGANEAHMRETLRQAVAVGAPLIAAPLVQETQTSWSDQLARLGVATSLAKSCNVTLAVRNAPQTFAASTHDCKRVAKEADSAWLRFGPEPTILDAASDPSRLAPNSVLLWSNVGDETERSAATILRDFASFCGHIVLDERSGDASVADLRTAVRSWQVALAALTLDRT